MIKSLTCGLLTVQILIQSITAFGALWSEMLRSKIWKHQELEISSNKKQSFNLQVGQAITSSFLDSEVWSLNLGPVKSDSVLPKARTRCDISSNGAVLHAGAMTRRWARPTRYTLQCNTVSIMKDVIGFEKQKFDYCILIVITCLFAKLSGQETTKGPFRTS